MLKVVQPQVKTLLFDDNINAEQYITFLEQLEDIH